MTLNEVMAELEKLGNEQTRKTWKSHGAAGAFFGVKIGDMKTIQKRIKKDHSLALELYNTGNADAMYFAGLICSPDKMSKKQLQDWAKNATWHMVSEYTVAWTATESNYGRELAIEWINSKDEQLQATGWSTYSNLLAYKKDEELDMEEIKALLNKVATTIHTQGERVKYTMNGFVISVGGYVALLTNMAKETGRVIGKVRVEMGGTACKVPDIVAYIHKMEEAGKIGQKRKTVFC